MRGSSQLPSIVSPRSQRRTFMSSASDNSAQFGRAVGRDCALVSGDAVVLMTAIESLIIGPKIHHDWRFHAGFPSDDGRAHCGADECDGGPGADAAPADAPAGAAA